MATRYGLHWQREYFPVEPIQASMKRLQAVIDSYIAGLGIEHGMDDEVQGMRVILSHGITQAERLTERFRQCLENLDAKYPGSPPAPQSSKGQLPSPVPLSETPVLAQT